MSLAPLAYRLAYIIIDFYVVIYPVALMYMLLKPALQSLRETHEELARKYEEAYREYEKAVTS